MVVADNAGGNVASHSLMQYHINLQADFIQYKKECHEEVRKSGSRFMAFLLSRVLTSRTADSRSVSELTGN